MVASSTVDNHSTIVPSYTFAGNLVPVDGDAVVSFAAGTTVVRERDRVTYLPDDAMSLLRQF
jgi:hypothetical protein